MSSPTQRRSQRASESVTPRQDQQNTEIPPSSPMQTGSDGPDEQLRTESQASQPSLQLPNQETPRANRSSQNTSQIPPASSPLFFRSSPANGSQDGANGVNISSPLRQESLAPSDGGATPRPFSQNFGGNLYDMSL